MQINEMVAREWVNKTIYLVSRHNLKYNSETSRRKVCVHTHNLCAD